MLPDNVAVFKSTSRGSRTNELVVPSRGLAGETSGETYTTGHGSHALLQRTPPPGHQESGYLLDRSRCGWHLPQANPRLEERFITVNVSTSRTRSVS